MRDPGTGTTRKTPRPRSGGAALAAPSYGSPQRDARVVAMQTHLSRLGYKVAVDGVIGPQTHAALAASQSGRVPNAVHHPEVARQQAQRQVAHEAAAATVRPYIGPTPPRLEPAHPATHREQHTPFWKGQKPHHYATVMSAGRAGVRTRITAAPISAKSQPVYKLPEAGPGGDDETGWNAQQAAEAAHLRVQNQGLPGVIFRDTLEGLLPTRVVHKVEHGQHVTLSDVGHDVLNGALWAPPTVVGPALRAARAGVTAYRASGSAEAALNALREAHGAYRTAAEDAKALRQAQKIAEAEQRAEGPVVSPVRDQMEAALAQAPNITAKQRKAILHTNDINARAVAHRLGVTPEQGYGLMWKSADFHNVNPSVHEMSHVLAQTGAEPEIANVAKTPETFQHDPEALARAAKNIPRHPALREGAPPHAKTPKAMRALFDDLTQRAIEAAHYRKWYANSAAGILQHVNGDTREADKIAALIAVYSPRAEVYSKSTEWNNLDRALNAYDEFKATGQISPKWSISSHLEGEGDWQTLRAQQIMQDNFEWQGLKTNRFYRNFLQHIDPEKYKALFGDEQFTTIDTWMRRAFGYPSTTKTEERTTLFGTENVPVGKKQEPITPKMYDFMDRATKSVADALGWTAEEAQAAIWTSIKAESEGTPLENAGFDFRDAFVHREARRARPLKPEQMALDTENTTADVPRKNVVQEAIDASRAPDSGFTLTSGLNADTGREGYAVAYGAHEYREAAPLTEKGLLDFRNEHLPLLRSDPALRVGGWHNPDDGQVYLDISRVFPTLDEALAFGREQGQLAIFDRGSMDVIPTGLSAEEADSIKATLKEQGRLLKQGAKYDDLLDRAYASLAGAKKKALNESDRRHTEDYLFEWANKNPEGVLEQQFFALYHDAALARNSPDPDLLFQDDELVQAIGEAHGRPVDREKVLAAHAGNDLEGLPKTRRSNANAQDIAKRYMRKAQLDYTPPTSYEKVDPGRARRIADWYDAAVDAPHDPEVRAAYDAMARETLEQYRAIQREGYIFEFYPEGVDPYPSGPSAAIDDLRSNRHMYVFPTEGGFGSLTEAQAAHPLLADSGEKWGGQKVTHNDIFRAVHDFFGHYKEGVGFRADGEENAWRAHSAMYSPQARRAMTSETRGQNSWVNYGPHGEANKTADQASTVYADQKAVLAPEWVVNEGSGQPLMQEHDMTDWLAQASPRVKGAVQRTAKGAILHLFAGADTSTALHEMAHAVEPLMPQALRDQLRAAMLEHPGPENYDEFVARSMERYFLEGQAPSRGMSRTFRTLAQAMREVYGVADRIPGGAMSPEIRRVFDSWFVREAQADPRWARAAAVTLFQSDNADPRLEAAAMMHEQANMSVEDAAKMMGVTSEDLQHHLDSGAHAAEQARILSNADVGAGEAATEHEAEHYINKWLNQDDEILPTEDDNLATPHEPLDDLSPEERVRQSTAGVRSMYGRQKVLRGEESRRRAQEVEKALRTIADPDEAMAAAAAAMRGEMPKIDFEGLTVLDGPALRHLKTYVNQHETLLPFQKVRLNKALQAAAVDNKLPTPSEMRLIEHVFGKKTAIGIGQSAGGGWGDIAINILNIPRSLMATADFSAVGRQALVAGASHPLIWGKNFPAMFRAAKNPQFYEKVMEDIKHDPLYNLALAARVSFTDIGEKAALEAHEEAFASDYAAQMLELVPKMTGGKVHVNAIKASARAYTGFLNKLRMDLFKNQVRIALAAGRDVHDEEFLKDIGKVINASTGRGSMYESAEHVMPALNTFLFSPRLMLSRINYLDPTWYVRLSGQARREALRGLFATAGAVTGALYLFSRIPGVDIGSLDPRSADFGKLKMNDTRVDVAGGFQQYVRLAAELATNTQVSSTSGRKTKLGSGFGVPTGWDVVTNFAVNKLAPAPSIGVATLRQEDAVGNPAGLRTVAGAKNTAVSNFTPLIFQDANDIRKEAGGGMDGIALALGGYGIGMFGLGLQTYKAKDPAAKPTKELTEGAKKAGLPPPPEAVLIDLSHKAQLDSISHDHPKDYVGKMTDALKYYAEQTGDHSYDEVGGKIASAKSAKDARTLYEMIRGWMIGKGVSEYEHAIKEANGG